MVLKDKQWGSVLTPSVFHETNRSLFESVEVNLSFTVIFKDIKIMKKKSNYPETRVKNPEPKPHEEDWVIWAAWADRITFEEIYERTGLTESEVIYKMRSTLKPQSFKRWRKRVHQKVSIKHRTRFKKQREEEQNWSLQHHLLRVETEHVQDDGFRDTFFKNQISHPNRTLQPDTEK
jgi:uncharacterized protein (TIGR03643 family)